jgi:hypothetical protein
LELPLQLGVVGAPLRFVIVKEDSVDVSVACLAKEVADFTGCGPKWDCPPGLSDALGLFLKPGHPFFDRGQVNVGESGRDALLKRLKALRYGSKGLGI